MNDYTENNQWDQTVYNSKVIVTLFVPLIQVSYFINDKHMLNYGTV